MDVRLKFEVPWDFPMLSDGSRIGDRVLKKLPSTVHDTEEFLTFPIDNRDGYEMLPVREESLTSALARALGYHPPLCYDTYVGLNRRK